MEQALTLAILAVLVTMALALIRAFMGPSAYNRMLAANMFGTKTVLLIALGGQLLGWPSFVDIALLYAMVNFVVTIAVMRFFEYDESADESPDGAAKLHPWVVAARNRDMATADPAQAQRAPTAVHGDSPADRTGGRFTPDDGAQQ